MKPTLHQLVDELLALDASLGSKRAEVERVVQMLLDEQMDTNWRPAFEKELLQNLREQMHTEKSAPLYSFFPFSLMDSKWFYAGGGALVGALLVFAVVNQQLQPSVPSPFQQGRDNQVAMSPTVTPVPPQSFGSLSLPAQETANGIASADESSIKMRPQSGGGGGGMDAAQSMIYPAPDYIQSRYVYDGDISLPEEDISVFKRVRPSGTPSSSSAVKGFAEGMLNWSALGSLNLQNVSMIQSGKDGYSVYIDYIDGSLSINKNFSPESRPDFGCMDQDCYERNRLRESDMLSDDVAIGVANDFLRTLGIDTSMYGEPIVADDWRLWLARTEEKMSFYFPEQLTVIFPVQIDGKMVYEEYGQPYGLTVSVDIRSQSASGLYNYYAQNYEQSSYTPVQNDERVREVLSRGGLYMWQDPQAKHLDVKLGEPTEGLMRYYLWNQNTFESQELLIPALIFPITEMPAEIQDQRKVVLVPLAEEILQQSEQNYPRPMPLMEPAAVDQPVMDIQE